MYDSSYVLCKIIINTLVEHDFKITGAGTNWDHVRHATRETFQAISPDPGRVFTEHELISPAKANALVKILEKEGYEYKKWKKAS